MFEAADAALPAMPNGQKKRGRSSTGPFSFAMVMQTLDSIRFKLNRIESGFSFDCRDFGVVR